MTILEIRAQRNEALACVIMAICITAAIFASVYGSKDEIAIENARSAVAAHKILLNQVDDTLRQNQKALDVINSILANGEHN